jgi:predicted TIM-barrel fold metal-dependent hydrolase
MIINLHGHQLTAGVFNQDPFWGPFFEDGSLRVGHWRLGTSKARTDADPDRMFLDRWMETKWGVESRVAALDAAGQDILVLSLPSHMSMYWAEPEFATRYASTVNEEFAGLVAQAPTRFRYWAQLPLQEPKAAAMELERAVTDLGAVGASAGGANFGGLEFHDPAFDPFWEKLCELDVPMFVHGYNQSVTWGERANDDPFDTTSIVGMPYDEVRCFWYLIAGGVFDRFPELKVYITHGGGYVPYQLGRLNETLRSMAPDRKNTKDLIEYLPNFWFDPLVHEAPMRRAIVDVIGPDRLLYGDNFGGADAINFDLTEGLGLSADDQDKIRWKNAAELLKIDVGAASVG